MARLLMRSWLWDGEQVQISCRPHARILIWPITVGLVLILAASAGLAKLQPRTYGQWAPGGEQFREPAIVLLVVTVGLLLLLYPVRRVLQWTSTRCILTSKRLMVRRGVLRRSWDTFILEHVQEIRPVQNWRQRMVGSGDLQLVMVAGPVRTMREVPELNRFNSVTQQAWSAPFRDALARIPHGEYYAGDVGKRKKELRKLGRDN